MAEKPFYATLEAFVPNRDEDNTLLVKKLPDTYLSGSVRDLVQKMLDPEADALNESYNALERDVADTVTTWFRNMNNEPNNYAVTVAALGADGNQVPLGLDDRVSNYSAILKVKEETDTDSGATERYQLIDLFAQSAVPGGGLAEIVAMYR